MLARAALFLFLTVLLFPLLFANNQDDDADDKLLAESEKMLDNDGPPIAVGPPGEKADDDTARKPLDPPMKKDDKPTDGGDGDGDEEIDSNKSKEDRNQPRPPQHPPNPATDGMSPETARRFQQLLDDAAKLAPNPVAAAKLHDAASHSLSAPPPPAGPSVAALQRDLAAARGRAATLERTLASERARFKRSLRTVREQQRGEMDEMRGTISEQKHAFDELYEEKRFMAHMLQQEQRTLRALQDKIQHPDLGQWIRQRAARAAILVETPETGAVKYYARKFMAPKVDKMRHRIETLERRVERTVDHLLPARYGYFVAVLLSVGLIAFPVAVSVATIVSWSKQMSLRQYVLLGNVFLAAFAIGLCAAGLLLRQDPLQTLYESGENLFILLQLLGALAFPCFLAVLLGAVLRSRDRLDTFVFGCELVFYVLVGLNYRVRVWRPAMLGQHIETGAMMYFVYVMDFVSMTALTISSSRMDAGVMRAWRDMESGVAGTYAAATSYVGATNGSAGAAKSGMKINGSLATDGVAESGEEDTAAVADVEVGLERGGIQQRASASAIGARGAGTTAGRVLSGRSSSGGSLAKLNHAVLKRAGSALQMRDGTEKDE